MHLSIISLFFIFLIVKNHLKVVLKFVVFLFTLVLFIGCNSQNSDSVVTVDTNNTELTVVVPPSQPTVSGTVQVPLMPPAI